MGYMFLRLRRRWVTYRTGSKMLTKLRDARRQIKKAQITTMERTN